MEPVPIAKAPLLLKAIEFRLGGSWVGTLVERLEVWRSEQLVALCCSCRRLAQVCRSSYRVRTENGFVAGANKELTRLFMTPTMRLDERPVDTVANQVSIVQYVKRLKYYWDFRLDVSMKSQATWNALRLL